MKLFNSFLHSTLNNSHRGKWKKWKKKSSPYQFPTNWTLHFQVIWSNPCHWVIIGNWNCKEDLIFYYQDFEKIRVVGPIFLKYVLLQTWKYFVNIMVNKLTNLQQFLNNIHWCKYIKLSSMSPIQILFQSKWIWF